MSKTLSFKTPTQAEVEKHIAHAHQMRSEYMAASIKCGFQRLRAALAPAKDSIEPV